MKRSASAVWKGDLKDGKGTISTESGVLTDTQYGEFMMDVKLGPTLEGRWSVGDGSSNGELKIARKK